MKKKVIRVIIISVVLLSMFANTPVAYAAFGSKYAAIKDTVENSRGKYLYNLSGVKIGADLPEEYSEYGFGTVKNTSKVFYGGATGGKDPHKKYWGSRFKDGTKNITYIGIYETNRVVSTAPKGKNENHNYWVCVPNAGEYNGNKIDVKGQAIDYLADSDNAIMAFGRTLNVTVLGIHWVKVKWSFTVSNGKCTGKAITVKGNTTYWDVDNNQGIMYEDSSRRGIYIANKNNKLKYDTVAWTSKKTKYSKSFIYLPSTYDNQKANNTKYGFTELFEGTSITRTYSFYETDGNSHGGIANSNKAIVCAPKSCRNKTCGCETGKTCWY